MHLQAQFSNVAAGGITSVISISISISLAAVIFSGPLLPWLPAGLGAILVGGVVMRLAMAAGSGLKVPLGTPLVEQLLLIAAASAAMQAAHPDLPPESLMAILMAGVIAATLITGLLLLFLGMARVGRWVEKLPSVVTPVFIAATGVLLVNGSLDLSFAGTPLPELTAATPSLMPGIVALVTAASLFALTRLVDKPLALPIAVVLLIVVGVAVNAGLGLAGPWLLGPFPSQSALPELGFVTLQSFDASLLTSSWLKWISIPLVTLLSLLLSVSGLGAILEQEVDLDRELRVLGVANLVSGGLGGTMGSVVLPDCALGHAMSGRGPIVAIISALGFGLMLIVDPSLLGHLPRPVFGGLVGFLALTLLNEGFGGARSQGRPQIAVLALALVGVVTIGFLEAVIASAVLAAFLDIAGVIKHTSKPKENI